MQAVILAAGLGNRLKHLTQDNTKCMIKVNGVPLIERMLRQLDEHKLSKIIMVVGYKGDKLQSFIDSLLLHTPIEYVMNPVYDKTNNIYSLYLAKDYLLNEDTLLLESDLVYEDTILTNLIKHPYHSLALVAKFESWMDGTVVTLDSDNNILKFIPKKYFSFEDISLYFKTVNIYKFSKEFSSTLYVPFLEAYIKSAGLNDYYEQVLRVITMLEKPELKALPLTGEKWYEIDDIQDLDIAESIFADESEILEKIQSRKGGFWRYPDLLNFSQPVNPFFPGKRLLSEIKANTEKLICEYPSGQSVIKLLMAKYLNTKPEYFSVGNGSGELLKGLFRDPEKVIGLIYPTSEEYLDLEWKSAVVPFWPSPDSPAYNVSDLMNFYSGRNISHLLIMNPDYSTGNFISVPDLLLLYEWASKREIILIIDESFVDFSEGEKGCNSLFKNQILEQNPNLIVIKNISCSNGIPGLRLSAIASGSSGLRAELSKDNPLWNTSSIAEFYLQIIGKYESDFNNSFKKLIEERHRFYNDLQKIEFLKVFPSQANFFLCEVLPPFTSDTLTRCLLKSFNILTRSIIFKNELAEKSFIQVAIRNKEDNERLIETFISLTSKTKSIY